MSLPPMRVRCIEGIAVVGVGPNAAGEPLPTEGGLVGLCTGGRGVVLDFEGSRPVSSAFLGHLIHAHRMALRAGIRLRVCCPMGLAREVLSEVSLDRLLPTYETLAEALADLDPPAR